MTPRAMREPLPSRDFLQSTLAEHGGSLIRLARRFSLCADDAQDAYQRAIEIFLRRAGTVEPETAASWLRTVVKHEAIAVRRSRLQLVGRDEIDLDLREATNDPSPDERLLSADVTARSAEALQRLKPQEVRALWLRAQGHSYAEIGAMCGWSYTKVNRCITEGRRAFLDRYAGIESGAECQRWAAVLSAMADGEATAEQLAGARPHLRNCPACRATLRDFHDVPREVGALVPTALAAGLGGGGTLRGAWHSLRELVASLAGRAPVGGEVAGAAAVGGGGTLAAGGMKVAALCASVSLAAGGAYCLDQTGALPTDVASKPAVTETPRSVREAARSTVGDRSIDRRARGATTRELVDQTTRDARPNRRRKRTAKADPPRPAAGQVEPTATGDTPGFTFESGDTGQAPPTSTPQPQPAPAPSESTQPPTGEFDGGGFE